MYAFFHFFYKFTILNFIPQKKRTATVLLTVLFSWSDSYFTYSDLPFVPRYSSDYIVSCICALLQKVFQSNSVKIFIEQLIETFPHLQCFAGWRSLALIRMIIQTGNRCHWTFRDTQDTSDRIFSRSPDQAIPSTFSSKRFDKFLFAQDRNNGLEIFLRNLLSIRNVHLTNILSIIM